MRKIRGQPTKITGGKAIKQREEQVQRPRGVSMFGMHHEENQGQGGYWIVRGDAR